MALPRPALLGILGALLILVTFVATHGVGKHGSSASPTPAALQASTPKPAQAKKAPAKPAKHAASKPVKHAATAPAKPVKHAARHTVAKKHAPVKAKVPVSQEAGSTVGLPVSVAKALAAHKVLVLFFKGSGVDDALTARSVSALKGSAGKGVAVFMDKLSNLAAYRRVVEGLDVSQAPSIVLVDRARKAQLIEGFIDAGSLRQAVADVTR